MRLKIDNFDFKLIWSMEHASIFSSLPSFDSCHTATNSWMIHLQQIEVHLVHISWSTFHCSFILQKVKVVIWMQAVGWKYTETKLTTFPGSPFFLLMFSRLIFHNGFSSNTSSYMWVLLPMVSKYQHCIKYSWQTSSYQPTYRVDCLKDQILLFLIFPSLFLLVNI